MSTADLLLATTVPSWDDELFQLELRVARRADELAAGRPGSRDCDREVWGRAECELLRPMATAGGSAGSSEPPAARSLLAEAEVRSPEEAVCLVAG